MKIAQPKIFYFFIVQLFSVLFFDNFLKSPRKGFGLKNSLPKIVIFVENRLSNVVNFDQES